MKATLPQFLRQIKKGQSWGFVQDEEHVFDAINEKILIFI